MLRVYNWMSSGLLLTGIVAYAIAHTGAIDAFFPLMQTASGRRVRSPTALAYIAMLAPLGFVLVLSFGVNRMSTTTVQTLFWAFCAAMGASLTERRRVEDDGLRVVNSCRGGTRCHEEWRLSDPWRKHGLSSCQQPR